MCLSERHAEQRRSDTSLGKTAAALTAAGIVGGILKMQLELPSFVMICITGVAFYGRVWYGASSIERTICYGNVEKMVKNMLYKGYK